MPDIISIGESMVELFADGPIATAPVLRKSYGGDAITPLVTAARLGSETAFISRVGHDPFELYLLANWVAEGIDVAHVKVIEGVNGLYVISLLPEGNREFAYYRARTAATTLSVDDLDTEYLRSAKIVHTTGVTQGLSPNCRKVVREVARRVRGHGPRFSYDPNLRQGVWPVADARGALGEILPYVDILLPSGPDEIFDLVDIADPAEAIDYFWSHGAKIVAVKLGGEGCLVGAEGRIEAIPAHAPGPAVDTTGAGSIFNGAFLHGLVSGLDAFQAARLAVMVAGLSVVGRGAVLSLPGRQQMRQIVAEFGGAKTPSPDGGGESSSR